VQPDSTLDGVVHVNTQTNTVAGSVPVGAPTDVAVGSHAAWVTSIDEHRVTRIDLQSKAVNGSFTSATARPA
jgi:hypothetical protein